MDESANGFARAQIRFSLHQDTVLPEEEAREKKLNDIKNKHHKFPIYYVDLGFEHLKRISYTEKPVNDNIISVEILIEMEHPGACMKSYATGGHM